MTCVMNSPHNPERKEADQSRIVSGVGETYERIVELKHAISHISNALGHAEQTRDEPGWRSICSIPESIILHDDKKPILVLCLTGPSGGGKSTIFKLLTGINVPSGSGVRPVSYNSVMAIPDSLPMATARQILPTFHSMVELVDPNQVRDKQLSTQTLLHAVYTPGGEALVHSMIADIPDFNTVETSNWDKAECMMARADLMLFVTQADNYKDDRVVEVLRRCCMSTGKLAYIITKVDGETPDAVRSNAVAIWDDMRESAKSKLESFRGQRADGQPLWQYLGEAEAFYSSVCGSPKLHDYLRVETGMPGLSEICMGMDAEGILRQRMLQLAQGGIELGRNLCDKAEARREKLEISIATVENTVKAVSTYIAKSEFPIGKFLDILVDTVNGSRPLWLQTITRPISWTAKLVRVPLRSVNEWVRRLRKAGKPGNVKPREQLEMLRLKNATNQLIDAWRGEFPELRSNSLSADRTTMERTGFLNVALPETKGMEWESYIREQARLWTRQHRVKALFLGSLSDVLTLLGGAMVVVDLAAGGIGTLSTLAAIGGGGMAMGFVLKVIEEFGLGIDMNKASQSWEAERGAQFFEHIRNHFARPLFTGAWEKERNELSSAPITDCHRLCRHLSDQMHKEGVHE